MFQRLYSISAGCATIALGCALAGSAAFASSHREAPFITERPKVDGTDFYMFRSYETGREGFVTLIANYLPLQDPYGGPNYFTLDEDARYAIHIDNDGDAVEDLTFRFEFNTMYRGTTLPIGPDGAPVTIPLVNVGPGPSVATVGPGVEDTAGLNVLENYSVTLIRGDRKTGNATPITGAGGNTMFSKPVDYIGTKTIPNYDTYAQNHVFNITIPGCATPGARVFVGQRAEGFVVNLGEVFDRVNLNPLGARNAETDVIDDKNITSLALEVPIACLTGDGEDPVIGGWTTASLPQAEVLRPNPTFEIPAVTGGAFTQVSRLGNPLVNEVVIGLDQKNAFNASEPVNDVTNFGTFVLYPTLPALIEVLFGVPAPATPRNDLLAVFVTGVAGLNQPVSVTPGEMLRLNTAIAPKPINMQNDLGFLGCDLAGFPNGRRPVDDVVDIELTVAMGAITAANPNSLQTCDLSGEIPTVVNPGAVVTDGALPDPGEYLTVFPYLGTPIPGSPTDEPT